MNESFILYTSDYQLIEMLTDAQLGQLLRALFVYTRDGETIELDPVVNMAFSFIKDKIDRNKEKYQKKCERLRANAQKRWGIQKDANNTEATKSIQTYADVYKSMQLHAKGCLSDSDSDSDSDVSKLTDTITITKPSKEAFESISGKPKVDAPKKAAKSQVLKMDYKAVKDYWNEQHDKTNSAMRRLTLMSEQRESNVRARLREVGGDVSKIYQAIDIAMQSDFMNGRNGRGWVASFDWIMCAKNFPKVLEGNFTDEPRNVEPQMQPSVSGKKTIGEQYQQAAHLQPQTQESQDNKYRAVIASMLQDLKKNPNNKPAHDSLARFYEAGVIQRLGIDWKP